LSVVASDGAPALSGMIVRGTDKLMAVGTDVICTVDVVVDLVGFERADHTVPM